MKHSYRVIPYDSELYHHGIKGQRWGILRTAAQLGHVVAKGTKKVAAAPVKAGKAVKKAKDKRFEKKKADAIASGDPTKINKYLKKMSNEEVNRAAERVRTVNNLKAQSATGMDQALKVLRKTADFVSTGKDIYSSVNAIKRIKDENKNNEQKRIDEENRRKSEAAKKKVEKVINSGDSDTIAKHLASMSKEQKKDAFTNIQLNKAFNDYKEGKISYDDLGSYSSYNNNGKKNKEDKKKDKNSEKAKIDSANSQEGKKVVDRVVTNEQIKNYGISTFIGNYSNVEDYVKRMLNN